MIRVMIVDDQEMIRAGLRTFIDATDDLSVVAEAAEGAAAIRRLDSAPADVILMDLRMPGVDGVEAIRRIREHDSHRTVGILVLTTFDEDENVLSALRAGADGFLSKGASPDELTGAIRRVARGEKALSATAVDALIDNLSVPAALPVDPAAAARFAALTAREREVVLLIVEGLDNVEIGRRIFVSPFTVKTHANRAMAKAGVRDRAQLVSLAMQAGLVP